MPTPGPLGPRRGLGRVLHHEADVAPVALVLVVLGFQLPLFLFVEDLRLLAAGAALLALPQGFTIACAHHHSHWRVFRSEALNRLYDGLLFLQAGAWSDVWELTHCRGHHRHYLHGPDDPSWWTDEHGRTLSRTRYVWRTCFGNYLACFRIGQEHPAVLRRFLFSGAAFLLGLLALLCWRPIPALLVFVLPMLLMLVRTTLLGYGHHAGLNAEDHFHASRNYVNRWFNRLSFNSGLHTVHHLHPELHWSQLGAVHEAVRQEIPEHLVTDSLWG